MVSRGLNRWKIKKSETIMATAKKAAKKTPAKSTDKSTAKKSTKNESSLSADYDPLKDKGEYMNPDMLEYFRQRLIDWRSELIRESSETQENLRESQLQKPDLADRASAETDHALELRTRDRERKLINKINSALRRIDDGEYGYCEETGDEIGVSRLMARPVATLSLEAQEMHERNEKIHRED
jgi:DnaK suppressor protein